MYYKNLSESFLVKKAASSTEDSISLTDFSFISAVSYSVYDECLFLTGIHKNGRLPSLQNNYRGDLKLYKRKLTDDRWTEFYNGYSHDPVPIPGTKKVAFYYGSGLAIADENGKLIEKCRLGKFSWGAPSLSASPNGNRVAIIKWQGDNQKLFVYTMSRQTGADYPPSLYRYSWYDEDHILYQVGHSLKLLDLDTGKTEVFLKEVVKLLPDKVEEGQDDLQELRGRNTKIEAYNYGAIKVMGDRVFFVLSVLGSRQNLYDIKVSGLFSINKSKQQLKLGHLLNRNETIVDFSVDTDGTIVMRLECYQGTKVVEQKRVTVGSPESLLNNEWEIMPSGLFPEFGFHYGPWF